MTEITDILGMQRSVLAELRRTREAVERIEQLLARAFEPPLMKALDEVPEEVRPGEVTFVEAAKPRDRIEPDRVDWVFYCSNSMHIHRSQEEAEACIKENRK